MENNWLNKSIEDRVSWYKEMFNKLMDLIGDKNFLSKEEKQKCELALKEIKEHFKIDNDFSNSVRRINSVPDDQQQYYHIIREASSRILSSTRSNPITSDWHLQLYDAQGDLEFYYPGV